MNLNNYNVLDEVSELVERQLEVMEVLGEARQYRMVVRSRLMCRCPRCVAEAENTLAWLEEMRSVPQPAAPEVEPQPQPPVQPKLKRIFGDH